MIIIWRQYEFSNRDWYTLSLSLNYYIGRNIKKIKKVVIIILTDDALHIYFYLMGAFFFSNGTKTLLIFS